MSADLVGTTAIVTGGARGIGAATVESLAKAGSRVLVLDIDGREAEAVAQRTGGVGYQVDARDSSALERFFDRLPAGRRRELRNSSESRRAGRCPAEAGPWP